MLTMMLFLAGLVIAVAVAIRVSRRATIGAGPHDHRVGGYQPGVTHYGGGDGWSSGGGGSCDSGGGGSC
ncbi:hypothetical protein OHA21_40075 [Actinoplanes sp. NBC_00393]|uniref:hypothetical protein n=1 Tax=Actinoplanes sp. NBC_00393 TaxID=2975953 RepID=UPI002E22F4C2